MNSHGIAIIGCGYWGVNYIRVFSELPEARVLVVCDQREERLYEIGKRFPYVELTTQVSQALAVPGVDAAIVCTPATSHFEIVRECLNAGKHVLVEKPITQSSVEAEALTNLAESYGSTLMVGHTFLYNPAIRKVKEYLERAETGRVYYMYARRTNMGPIRHDVNALWDLASHDIAIFNYLLNGKPEWVSAVGSKVLRNSREDVGFVTLGYPHDVIAHIHVSWADAYKVREVVVVASERRIVFNDFNPLERVRVFEKGVASVEEASSYGEFQLRMRDGDIVSPRIEATEPLKNECSHFLECIATGQHPFSDGRQGRDVVQVLEAIDRSVSCYGGPMQVSAEQYFTVEPRYAGALALPAPMFQDIGSEMQAPQELAVA